MCEDWRMINGQRYPQNGYLWMGQGLEEDRRKDGKTKSSKFQENCDSEKQKIETRKFLGRLLL